RGDPVEECAYLPVDDDRVQALLAAEVLVDDRLGDLRTRRDLLDGGRVEAPFGEELAPDGDELFTSLGRGHPYPGHFRCRTVGHWVIVPVSRRCARAWASGRRVPSR